MRRCLPKPWTTDLLSLLLQRSTARSSLRCDRLLRSDARRFSSDEAKDYAAQQHKLFLEQIQELDQERQSLFGSQEQLEKSVPNSDLLEGRMQRTDVEDSTVLPRHEEALESLEAPDWKFEREALYGFTEVERDAWSTGRNHKHSPEFLQEIEQAREQLLSVLEPSDPNRSDATTESEISTGYSGLFTHLARDGTTVNMVDVSSKVATHRTATAQSSVVFPEEVLTAFGRSAGNASDHRSNELVGPKGPIFATSITAGIMAAKQTSNLIPLCHPLPLEKVHVEISWASRNTIVIECTCSVTHKTGVEMEALVGASVAALTVYDMVKAVSHDVRIVETQLIQKSGGKRHVSKR
jgi:cyclic pyranopterin monophosphate synthase